MMKPLCIILLFLSLAFTAGAQVTFQFVPEVYGRNVNGLFNCRIINITQSKAAASLTVTVTEKKAGLVCTIKTPEFTIYPGANMVSPVAARAASVQFSNTKLGQVINASRAFPEGDYDYCFSLSFTHSDNPPVEDCFSYALAPFSDLNLIDPFNTDQICDTRPVFTWEPLIPGVPGSYYQLVLSEIKSGQSAIEALNYNVPVINQNSIIAPVLPYPAVARELEKGKKYAWQVTAYQNETILNRSDIWEFTVNCEENTKKITDDGYRNIEDITKGDYYVAVGALKFIVVNSYAPQKLKYVITPIFNAVKDIHGLAKIKLTTGYNQVNIDLSDNSAFIDGKYYLLKVWLPDGTIKYLRFLYNEVK